MKGLQLGTLKLIDKCNSEVPIPKEVKGPKSLTNRRHEACTSMESRSLPISRSKDIKFAAHRRRKITI